MDDEDIVADIAKQMLEYLGYEVSLAVNGEEAIELYTSALNEGNLFSLVIMDLNIPNGMGGFDAVKHIIEIDNKAKVMVSTGYSSDPIMQDYSKYGFCGCIAKPFDLKGLEDAVLAALQ